tara:strand:+ start:4212 stop:4910 length:699 start_codon:yes stop_codon:yes gene_type:complete
MATLNELAYNIRNIARSGQGNSDDDRLTISQIKFWIRYYRSEGILQTTNYGKEIHPQMVQDLGVVPLVEVDATDSDCPTVQWGCKIKKVVVPKFVDFPKDRAIVFVGKIDKREPFILGNADVSYFKSATQFGTMMSRVSMIGDNMYFQLNDRDSELEYVNIRGVFEDPTKVDQYAVAGCKPACFNDATSEYPLPLNLYVYVLSNILQKELQWNEAAVNDELNNARKDNQKIG